MQNISCYLGREQIRWAFPGVKRGAKRLASKQRRSLDRSVILEYIRDTDSNRERLRPDDFTRFKRRVKIVLGRSA